MAHHHLGLVTALGITVLAASCVELPETRLKPAAGRGGMAAAAGGMTATAGGRTGAGGMLSGSGAGGASTAGGDDAGADTTGSGGSNTLGGTGGTAGKSGTGGKGGSAGKGGTAGRGAGAGGTGNTDPGAAGDAPGGAANGGDDGGSVVGGDSLCATSSFALCEDFEGTSIDTTRWQKQQSTGSTVAIDTTRAARGSHSAHFHTEDNGLSLLHQSATFPAPDNTYYVRVFAWFDSMPTEPEWAHWSISGAQADDDEFEVRVGGQFDPQKNKNLFGVGTDHGITGDWTNLDEDDGAQPVPVKRWVCVEWMHDGAGNETRFWWDGVEHPSLRTSETLHGGTTDPYILPHFDQMWVGWWLYQEGTNPDHFDVWLDEVAVDYTRIGCDQ